MRFGAPLRILTVAALCVAALIGLVVNEGAARTGGVEALLPMEAVDPRSLLSGHYVQLNLTQRLEPGETCPPGGPESEWLALQVHADVHELAGGAETREEARAISPVSVRGSFDCSIPTEIPDAEPIPGWVRLNVGIDRFYINQADALRIERVLREQAVSDEPRAYAIVSIGRDGRARLKGLMIDGERLELNWL